MKVTVTPVKPVPTSITLELDAEEMRLLRFIAKRNIKIPELCNSGDREVMTRFLNALDDGLGR